MILLSTSIQPTIVRKIHFPAELSWLGQYEAELFRSGKSEAKVLCFQMALVVDCNM